MQETITVLIADDQKIFVDALTNLLGQEKNMKVVGTAHNGIGVLEKIRKAEPDILILDYEMPHMDGKQTSIEIVKNYPKVKIIILSMYDEAELVQSLFEVGVHSFLSKGCDSKKLIEVIRIVMEKGKYVPDELAERLQLEKDKFCSKALNLIERTIIRHMCFGKRDKEITDCMDISINTLKFHKENIKTKTGISTPAQMGVYGVKHNIVNLRDFRLK